MAKVKRFAQSLHVSLVVRCLPGRLGAPDSEASNRKGSIDFGASVFSSRCCLAFCAFASVALGREQCVCPCLQTPSEQGDHASSAPAIVMTVLPSATESFSFAEVDRLGSPNASGKSNRWEPHER